ncbi:MAG: prephenate dehydrogenase/arogenate dehydrogenase family protein [Candidatus Liptonbacteria bacterium]|nr:prephenate dehydrogenase/arogenate dehydrogenase family protein [Candidatus Liptonbacteria bacterium]
MKKAQSKFTQAVIGAKGNMGRFLAQHLVALAPVIEIDADSSAAAWRKAWKADVIWLSIPREAIDSTFRGKKLNKNQLVVDICSVKSDVGRIIGESGATHLSLHPLHGPKVPLIGQRWAVIQTSSHGEQHPLGRVTLDFFRKQGVAFLPPVPHDQHDFMMGVTLSIPEVLTVVLDRVIGSYAKRSGKPVPSQEELMRWAVPASNAIFGAYVHIVNSTPEWLRYEIVKQAPHDVLGAIRDACRGIEELSLGDVEKEVAEQAQSVHQISPAEQDRIRRWINQWFVDSTKTFFKTAKESRVKPALNIQWMEKKEAIFPRSKKSLTVGIHGIDGCFTHEALLRFLEENGISEHRVAPKFLVTAENVLEAVTSGKTDLGIFAIANSGSGAYVSSMAPIAKHTFKVQAVMGMEIMQCLLAHKSVKSVDGIKEVFGHPQAVSQCKRTLEESYPRLKVVAGKDSDDTALCAKWIAEGILPRTTATLASQIAARRYGLNIISYNMHHDPFNTTTFLLVSRK